MKILKELCSVPTAPFAEHLVFDYVKRFVAERPWLKLRRDRFNNLLIELPGRTKSPRLVFVAHMDHPGFVAKKMIDRRTVLADFYGGVLSEYVINQKVLFFDGDREIHGKVVSTKPSGRRSNYPGSAIVRLSKPANVTSGVPGMFDQGPARVKGSLMYSRVCDDLGGVSSVLAMLDELCGSRPRTTVCALLTRAEEDGFIGAIASVLYPTLLRKTDRVISIETSAMQPAARQGEGVVLRVGDYTSIFNSSFMYFIHQQAAALKKSDKKFKYQRSLMPGGTCEATVFDAYGYVTGAICVPLGNYHNMNRETKKIGPEYIDVNDWRNMVSLFVRLAKTIHTFDGSLVPLQKKIEKHFRRREKLLLKTAAT